VNAAAQPAGYSGVPLAKKLGFKEGSTVLLIDAPAQYRRWIHPVPTGVKFVSRCSRVIDVAHVFVTRRAQLQRHLSALRKALNSEVPIWISLPKKLSKMPTDLTDHALREVALPLGFVDIKVCAVSEGWSGLKLVVRKENRRPSGE
jgi:hypothetical protein